MKNNLLKLMLSLFAIVLFIGSCDVADNQPTVDTDAAQDNSLKARASGDVFAAVQTSISGKKSLTACPLVTFEIATGKLKLDYGTGCVGDNGLMKSGIIYATVTGYSAGWVEGTKAVVTFDGFKIDDKPLTGQVTITAHVNGNTKSFTFVGTDMALTFSDNTKIQWSENSTSTLVNTDNYGKYWSVTGSSTGVSRKGVNFSSATEALLTDPRCKWFVGGTLSITAGDNVDVITFGATCGSVTIKHNNLPAIPLTLI